MLATELRIAKNPLHENCAWLEIHPRELRIAKNPPTGIAHC